MLPHASDTACPILVGTSGYSYAEWADAGFYPPGTKAGEMLPLYARQFGITELNFTWYQMPKAPAVERMRRLAPPGFRFAAKLTRTLTHEVDPGQWRGQAAQYRDGIGPLLQAQQLCSRRSSSQHCCCSSRRGSPAMPPVAGTSPSFWTRWGGCPWRSSSATSPGPRTGCLPNSSAAAPRS